jgi:DNA primase RepB-like protein
MSPDEAERLQRAMAREFGGDPAATDSTRVLRLPRFYNKKYEPNHRIEAEPGSTETHRLEHFKLSLDEAQVLAQPSVREHLYSGHHQGIRHTPSDHPSEFACSRIGCISTTLGIFNPLAPKCANFRALLRLNLQDRRARQLGGNWFFLRLSGMSATYRPGILSWHRDWHFAPDGEGSARQEVLSRQRVRRLPIHEEDYARGVSALARRRNLRG